MNLDANLRWERWTIDEITDDVVRVVVAQSRQPDALEPLADLRSLVMREPRTNRAGVAREMRRHAMAAELDASGEMWAKEREAFFELAVLAPFLGGRRRRKVGLPASRSLREGDVFLVEIRDHLSADADASHEAADSARTLLVTERPYAAEIWDLTAAARQSAKRRYHLAIQAGEPPTLNLTAISELPATDPIICYLAANADEYLEGEGAVVGGPGGFRERYLIAITARKAAIAAQDDTPEKQKLAQAADDRVVYLHAIAAKVAGLANLFRLKAAFATWKRDVIGAVIVVAFAIALFGWAANPPKADAAHSPNLTGASLVGADLSNADLTAADLTGADLTDAVLLNAKLDGAIVDRVTWKNTTCPDGVNSDKAGGTCKGHLD